MLENLTIYTFSEQLHTRFPVRLAETNLVELELVEVIDLGSTPSHEQFSLRFRGPRDPWLPQQIFEVEHERIGAFKLFLVPIGRDETGMDYEAIFNRRRKTAGQ